MLKISGLDKLTNTLEEAQKALKDVDCELDAVRFDPDDPAGIEAAIQEVERLVDEKLGAYASNPIIGPMAEAMKESYRNGIIEKATEARLARDNNE